MTNLTSHACPPGATTGPPVSWAGVLAALRAATLGLLAVMVPVLMAWATAADSGASATEAVRAGLQVWLVGHGARLEVPGGEFGLTPLGLTLLPAALLFSSAAQAARTARVARVGGRRGVVSLTAAHAASYGAVAVIVALLARGEVVQPRPVTAFAGAVALAALAGGAGALRASGRGAVWWSRLPASVRLAATGACGAVLVLLAGGALLVALMLARHHDSAAGLVGGLDGGGAGDLLILLVCLALAPTAVVWGATYLVGPGFAVGAGSTVAATGVHVGPVPALPLLAALPTGDGSHGWAVAAAAVALAGTVGGLLVDRAAGRLPDDPTRSWRGVGRAAGLTGLLAGLAMAALAAATSGPAGPGRLTHVGPTWWLVAVVTALEVAGAVGAVLLVRRRRLMFGPDHPAVTADVAEDPPDGAT